jgi:hypothetical protein
LQPAPRSVTPGYRQRRPLLRARNTLLSSKASSTQQLISVNSDGRRPLPQEKPVAACSLKEYVMLQSIKRNYGDVLWWLAFCCGSLVLVMHFALIELSNLPSNPISLSMSDAVSAYVNPLFTQNWNFFAPTPIASDIIVKARAKACGRGKCQATPWLDISDPLIAKIRENRLSSLGIIQQMLSNASVQFDNTIQKSEQAHVHLNGKVYYKRVVPVSIDPYDAVIIQRTSAAALRLMYPQKNFQYVQFGLARYEFPRYTQRNQPDKPEDATFLLTDWKPFPNDIAVFAP